MKRILFPIVRDVSHLLVPTVIKLATSLDAEVHALHITAPTDAYLKSRMISDQDWLKSFVDKYFAGHKVKVAEVVPGDPAEEIISYAEKHGIGMIIMGTHGRKGFDRFYFGSVVEHVVAQASAPVLSINTLKIDKLDVDLK